MLGDQEHVLAANQAFYQAFDARDFSTMDELWAREHGVTCIHPGWNLLVGREAVMASWRAILRSESIHIEPSGVRVFLLGDAAYIVCHEAPRGETPILVATNIFVREQGRWRLVHHQAGQLATPPDAVASTPTN